MSPDDKNVTALNSIEKVASRGMSLTEALYEILADKGVLTGDRVIKRIKKLESGIKANLSSRSMSVSLAVFALRKIPQLGRIVASIKKLVHRDFHGAGKLFQRLARRN